MKRNIKKFLALFLICLLSVGGISEPVLAAGTNTTRADAQKKVWDIINKYADPDYFLEDVYHYRTGLTGKKEMSDSQYKKLRQTALDATKNCKTQYEKIKAITEYVANRVYYDYKYLYNKNDRTCATYYKPYDVYKNKRAVCSGYTALTTVLFVSIGIPCMELSTNSHTYNAAYDRTARRWVFVDTTWCSNNRYGHFRDQELWVTQDADFVWFDKTPEELGSDDSHCVYWVDGLTDQKYNSAYYRLCTGHDSWFDSVSGWTDTGNWYLSLTGAKKSNLKAAGGFAGLKVREARQDPRQVGTSQGNQGNKKLKTVDLSETDISLISGNTFARCTALTKVTFPASLKEIGVSAFSGCEKLKEIDLSGTKVSKIGISAFSGCKAAKTIYLPSTLKTIGNYAFSCWGISNVNTKVFTTLSKSKLKISDKQKGIWSGRKVTLNQNVYTIEFDGNGATGGRMSKQTCVIGTKAKLSANQYKRSGYQFTGWSTKKNGKGKIYKNKASVKNMAKKGKTIKLYAQWKKKG